MRAYRHLTAEGIEWEAIPDSGVLLSSGEEWEGVRVRYRPVGTRRWSRFVLVHPADAHEIAIAIEAHSRKDGGQ